MATFQQPALPSMAIPNQNAPTSQLPEVQQQPQKENLGVTLAQGIGSVVNSYQQGVAAQKTAAFKDAYGKAYASGDRNAMIKLAENNPDQIKAIQEGAGLIDENTNKAIGNASVQLRVAGQQGTDAVTQAATANKDALAKVGVTPEQVVAGYQQDPDHFNHYADQIGMAALGPKEYFDTQDKIVKNGLTQRGQDLTAANEQANRDVTIRGQNISASNAAADRQIRMAELQETKATRQLQQAKTGLEVQAAQEKLQAAQQQKQQVKMDTVSNYDSSMDTLDRTIKTANAAISSPGFSNYFGVNLNPLNNTFVPGSPANDTKSIIDTLKSQNFLSSIQQMKGFGNLSNAEGDKLNDSIAALSPSMSEKQAKVAIGTIIDTVEKAQARLRQRQGSQVEQYRSEFAQQQDNQQQASQQQPAQPQQQQASPTQQQAQPTTVSWGSMQ